MLRPDAAAKWSMKTMRRNTRILGCHAELTSAKSHDYLIEKTMEDL